MDWRLENSIGKVKPFGTWISHVKKPRRLDCSGSVIWGLKENYFFTELSRLMENAFPMTILKHLHSAWIRINIHNDVQTTPCSVKHLIISAISMLHWFIMSFSVIQRLSMWILTLLNAPLTFSQASNSGQNKLYHHVDDNGCPNFTLARHSLSFSVKPLFYTIFIKILSHWLIPLFSCSSLLGQKRFITDTELCYKVDNFFVESSCSQIYWISRYT